MNMFAWSSEEGLDPNPPGLERGEVIGGYVLGDLLGSGGMGHVFRAFDPRTGRDVAIKLVRAGNVELSARLQREGELIAALEHPGILRIHASGSDSDWAYLVCELIEGARKLSELLDGPQELLLDYLAAASEALGHAHARGVLHRDVKADNFLVDAGGQLKVTDFGLGWRATATRLTLSGVTLGTPYAMAPEQVHSSPEKWGPATDVWGLGVLLYQILTGEVPFDAVELIPLCSQIASATPRRPSTIRARVSPALSEFCLRALAKSPADRPASGAEFARELAAARAAAAPQRRWLVATLLVAAGAIGAVAATLATTREQPAGSPLASAASPASSRSAAQPGAAVAAGPTPRSASSSEAELERRLADPQISPAEAGRLHLELAQRPGRGRKHWEQRLAHGQEAERLLGATPEVGRAQGWALRRLLRRPEATAVYRQVAEQTGAPDDLETFAHAAHVQGHPAVALEALAKISQPSVQQLRLRCLALRALGRREEFALGVEAVRQGGAPGLAVQLELTWKGEITPRELRGVLAEYPGDLALSLACAWHAISKGDLPPARHLLAGAKPVTPWERTEFAEVEEAIAQIEAALSGEDEVDPRYEVGVSVARGQAAWRAAWTLTTTQLPLSPTLRGELLREVEQGLAGLGLAQDLDAATWGSREVLIRALLAPEGSDERWEGLEAANRENPSPLLTQLLGAEAIRTQDPTRGEVVLAVLEAHKSNDFLSWALEARLRLRKGDQAKALEFAERALPQARWDPEICVAVLEVYRGLGRTEEATRWGLTYRHLTQPTRERSAERFSALGSAPADERERLLRELLFQDPLYSPARLRLLDLDLTRAKQGARVDLRSALVFLSLTLRQDPRSLPHVIALLRRHVPQFDFQRLWEEATVHGEPLPPAMLLLAVAEIEGSKPDRELWERGLGILDGAIAARPGEEVFWLLRGLVSARVGEWHVAERDLAWFARVVGPLPLVSFRRALVAGALKRAPEQILALLERARREGFRAWEGASDRPEFATVREHPRFLALVGD